MIISQLTENMWHEKKFQKESSLFKYNFKKQTLETKGKEITIVQHLCISLNVTMVVCKSMCMTEGATPLRGFFNVPNRKNIEASYDRQDHKLACEQGGSPVLLIPLLA